AGLYFYSFEAWDEPGHSSVSLFGRPLMRTIVTLAAVASLGFAAVASAAPAQLSDGQFIAANRCLGLMSSKALGTPDAAALKKLIDSQTAGRDSYIYDKADEARQDALRQAGTGSQDARAKLTAERDSVCRSFISDTTTAAQPAPSRS